MYWGRWITLLVSVQRLLEDAIASEDHDDGQVLIHQGQHSVLQFTRHDSLAMQVRDFLDLQGTLERSSVLVATSEKEQRLLVVEELGNELLDRLVLLEDVLDLSGNLAEAFDNLFLSLDLGSPVLAQGEREHDQCNVLGSVRLGRRNADLGSGVDVDTAVSEERNRRTDNIDDTDGQGAALQTIAQGHERIGGLSGLRDKNACI